MAASAPSIGIYDPTAAAARNPWVRRFNLVQDALLVVVSALFFYQMVPSALEGNFINAGFAIEQGILVGMFLTRRRSKATSSRWIDWVVAAGGWTGLLVRPHDGAELAAFSGAAIQLAGLGLTCYAMLTLGRSFGVVAANRGLKINGPYRLVRHPIYLAHTITLMGFVVANFTPLNLAIALVTTALQILRIRAEERVLSATGDYDSYRGRVRWRLLPGVF